MSVQVRILQPHSFYLSAYSEYYMQPISGQLSTASVIGISVGGEKIILFTYYDYLNEPNSVESY